eukprot:gene2534-2695_t
MLPLDILSFWFGVVDGKPPRNDVAYIQSRIPLWFGKNEEFEQKQRELAETGLNLVRDLENKEAVGQDGEWNTPSGYLARVILFDQLPRSVFRATAKAFEFDHLAVKYALKIVEEGIWSSLSAIERLFLIVSIQHSEDLQLQRKGVGLARIIAEGENEEVSEFFRTLKGFPMEHHDVIEQFGRFPGRNAVLGRDSTEDELAWLNSPDCPSWAKSQMKV